MGWIEGGDVIGNTLLRRLELVPTHDDDAVMNGAPGLVGGSLPPGIPCGLSVVGLY
jgi:hypothetical protein